MSNGIEMGSSDTGKRVNQIKIDQQTKECEPLPLFHAQQIKKSFFKGKKEIPVIRGVDLKIKTGELVAITGASGVGKSTLLHILGTLEPPTSGRVLFGPKQENLFQLSEKVLSNFR